MALPIAHAAAGYLVHRAERRLVDDGRPSIGGNRRSIEGWRRTAVLMLVANLPDMDFLLGFVIGEPGRLHRGASHTVLAAVGFAIVAGAFLHWWRRERFGSAALVFGAAYLSHLVLDYFTIDTRPPAGVQILWPFSSAHLISPVTIFAEITIDGRTRADFLRTVLAWPTVVVLVRELVMAAVALGAWQLLETGRVRGGPARGIALEAHEEDLA